MTGFDPSALGDRGARIPRRRAGLHRDRRRIGRQAHLLRRVIAAFPEAKERVPDLRMVVVAGPRIDPERPAAARQA